VTGVAATLYTVCDARYFLGVVALRNSLAITNPGVELVVLDRGLTEAQRRRLEPWCRVVPVDRAVPAHCLKPQALELEPRGVVATIDSDMVVVAPLDDLFASAAAGRVVAFEDPHADRWFAEWEGPLALPGPPRRQPYVNAGFVALSAERQPELLARWRDACGRLPARREDGDEWADPFRDRDQDALNAVLMSAYPRGALEVRPAREAPVMEELRRTRLEDPASLRATLRGAPVAILHAAGPRKPFRAARIEWTAYARAMPRVLLAPDVPVRVERGEVPPWLRGSASAAALGRALGIANDLGRAALERLPSGLSARAQALGERLLSRASSSVRGARR
jgi:hypothetical protein